MSSFFFKSSLVVFLLLLIVNSQAQSPATFDPKLGLSSFDGEVNAVRFQSTGKAIVIGDFTHYKSLPAPGIIRLNIDGSVDPTFNVGTGVTQYTIECLAIQADDKIIVGGTFTAFNGANKKGMVRLSVNGSVDNSFDVGTGSDGMVQTIAIQPDGKIFAGGYFIRFNGEYRPHMVRLKTNGALDNTFAVGLGFNNRVESIVLQADGKVLAGGMFTTYQSVTQNYFVRLNDDGSFDNTLTGTGANGFVRGIAIQPNDNKMVLYGEFSSYNGIAKSGCVRLETDGQVDEPFNIVWDFNVGYMNALVIQPDGKLIIASATYTTHIGIKRFFADGSPDNSFNVTAPDCKYNMLALDPNGNVFVGGLLKSIYGLSNANLVVLNADGSLKAGNALHTVWGANSYVSIITLQADGKILVAGQFSLFNGVPVKKLIRLYADGSLDTTFNDGLQPRTAWGINTDGVTTIVTQPDGKILIGGYVNQPNAQRRAVQRLNADGTVDPTFNMTTETDRFASALAIQDDGKIVLTGTFARNNGLIRLHPDGSIDQTFAPTAPRYRDGKIVLLQPDGKILFAGRDEVQVQRVLSNGKEDVVFSTNLGSGFDGSITSIALQPDGKILVLGSFHRINGVVKPRMARLNADGTLDNTFNLTGGGLVGTAYTIVLQPDGKILVGGAMGAYDGTNKNGILRLNSNGTLDNTFDTGTTIGWTDSQLQIQCVVLQPDGRILVGGHFTMFNKVGTNYIFRLQGNLVKGSYNTLRGSVYTDANADCLRQGTENTIPYVLMKAMPGLYYTHTDATGAYQLKVDTGTVNYTVEPVYRSIQAKVLIPQCSAPLQAALKGYNKDTCCFDFAASLSHCSLLNVSIQNSRMRRCARSSTFVNYTNYGDATASNAVLKVIYPSHVVPLSSEPMWTSRQDSVLIYELGSIEPSFQGRIIIRDSVVCGDESIRGLTKCIQAIISPKSDCVAENSLWDRSSVQVTGTCESGTVRYKLTNIGTGGMGNTQEYRLYENDTLIYKGFYQLNPNQYFNISYPAKGKTIRLEADQHPLHPGQSRPRLTLDHCGVAAQRGISLVTTTAPDDLDEETAITCNTIVDSYDPNDKTAVPAGVGEIHRVMAGQELEYIVRFQNTGSDTAYTIRIIDTLDTSLDVTSFTEGASSHPYQLQVSGKGKAVLHFNFYSIYLPAKATDEVKSNGLVSFRIKVPAGAANGSVIKNKAAIYFDYNSPVITNETFHTIGDEVDMDLTKGEDVIVGQLVTSFQKARQNVALLYPNPTSGVLNIDLTVPGNGTSLRIVSMLGTEYLSTPLQEGMQSVNLSGLPKGIYLYQIWQSEEQKDSGLLQVK